jgi:hypothetical protein
MTDETTSGNLSGLMSPIVDAIDAAWAARPTYENNTLSFGQLGNDCDRQLWYGFRWANPPEAFSGRMRRLFETGNIAERAIVADLQAAGIKVSPIDPATGRQWAVLLYGGHIKGYADGKATNVPTAPVVEHLLEIKTHNDKSFKDLKKNGVAKAKPAHAVQMQALMHGLGLTRALYVAKNKNDDELYAERLHFDATHAISIVARAERIVNADDPPPKLHDDPESKAAFQCKFCPARSVCHERAMPRQNCRTCMHSTARPEGGWHCRRWDKSLTPDEQRAGCVKHLFLPGLVPGEQIDADETAETVTYRMADGSEWIDGGRAA